MNFQAVSGQRKNVFIVVQGLEGDRCGEALFSGDDIYASFSAVTFFLRRLRPKSQAYFYVIVCRHAPMEMSLPFTGSRCREPGARGLYPILCCLPVWTPPTTIYCSENNSGGVLLLFTLLLLLLFYFIMMRWMTFNMMN